MHACCVRPCTAPCSNTWTWRRPRPWTASWWCRTAIWWPSCTRIPKAPPNHYPIAREELYDLAADPGETRNLAADQPGRVAQLAQLIRQRFAGLRNRTHPQEMPEKLKKELENLGYAVR